MVADPESIEATLRRRLNQCGLRRVAEAARVCAAADELAAGRYRAIRYQDGTLWLHVPHAVALAELVPEVETLSREITRRLNQPAAQPIRIKLTLRAN